MEEEYIINKWVEDIRSAVDGEFETQKILNEIDREYVSLQVKKDLLEKLFVQLSLPPRLNNGFFILNEQQDNKYYLELIKKAIMMLDSNRENTN